jgi:hypothetical protein
LGGGDRIRVQVQPRQKLETLPKKETKKKKGLEAQLKWYRVQDLEYNPQNCQENNIFSSLKFVPSLPKFI